MTTNPKQVVDRHRELADFLRSRRERIAPTQVGLPGGTRRRTPGLRREELAQLAGLSVDWYTRLEQGRDVTPSKETLEAIAQVLRLDDVERGHLFFLARPEHRPAMVSETPDAALAALLGTMTVPAFVMSPRFDVLAWNHAATRLHIDWGARAAGDRNIVRLTFLDDVVRSRYRDIERIERETVATFRGTAASYVGHPDFDALVGELLSVSDKFAAHWARHEVAHKTSGSKVFVTPLGDMTLDWHAVVSPNGSRQQLVFYRGREGSPDEALLRRLLDASEPLIAT